MAQSGVRVRRATPGDVDAITPLVAERVQPDQSPSADRVQYAFSLIVTEPNVEIYVAEAESRVVGFLTLHYLEYLGRGELSAVAPEVVVQPGAFEGPVLRGLLARARQAAAQRRCRRLDLYVPVEQQMLAAVAQELGFQPTAQGLSAGLT